MYRYEVSRSVSMQAAARSLSKRLSSPPIELALVEASVRVFRQIPASSDAHVSADSFAGVVPTAVVTFLRRRVSFIPSLLEIQSEIESVPLLSARILVCILAAPVVFLRCRKAGARLTTERNVCIALHGIARIST